MKQKRVGIVGLLHESNTFVDGVTTYEDFSADLLLKGDAIVKAMREAPHEVGGFLEGLAKEEIEAVPLFLARALPYGLIETACFERLVGELLEQIRCAGPLDGILAAPHGATVAENALDADGEWLSRLRDEVGTELPVIATIDPHANLSPRMVEATNALIAYSTNPHLDQRQTGISAARLMGEVLAGSVDPVQASCFPNVAINIQSQNTSEEPLLSFYRRAAELAEVEGIVSHSIVLGFPYADVPEMGTSVVVVSDGNREVAESVAREIGKEIEDRKESWEPEFLSVTEAVTRASESSQAPVVLLDMGDNVGGGSPADSTSIALEWLREGEGKAFVCLKDEEGVCQAQSVGAGGVLSGSIGDPSNPIEAEFLVKSLHDGKFRESEARHGGFSEFDQGDTAVLVTEDGKLTVMVTSRRMAPFSLSQLLTFGIDPESFAMIVAKGVIAPMAAYAEVAKGGFLHVDSPGVTRANMRRLSYRNRRKPLFPFEEA